jgi:hypothetical protein
MLLSYPTGAQVQGQLDMHKPSPFWSFLLLAIVSSVFHFAISNFSLVLLICVPIVTTSQFSQKTLLSAFCISYPIYT